MVVKYYNERVNLTGMCKYSLMISSRKKFADICESYQGSCILNKYIHYQDLAVTSKII